MTDLKEIPNCCAICPLSVQHGDMRIYCTDADKIIFIENERPYWCRLREIPEKLSVTQDLDDYDLSYIQGRNECINEMLYK
jgi:hypothetical protein